MFGSERYYSFDHLSIQEFLAAIHLASMRNDQQLRAVKLFLHKSPRSQILSFYAGLTGLSNEKVLRVLSKSLETARDSETIVEKLRSSKRRNDPQQEALTFLKCLFECNNESVWKLSETDLHVDKTKVYKATLPSCHDEKQLHELSLHSLALTPFDCLSLGYYIQTKSCLPKSQLVTLNFDLISCCIDPNLEGIALCACFDPSVVDHNFVLKSLIEGLSDNSSCGFIDLSIKLICLILHTFTTLF